VTGAGAGMAGKGNGAQATCDGTALGGTEYAAKGAASNVIGGGASASSGGIGGSRWAGAG
jgi:hypothetical protein